MAAAALHLRFRTTLRRCTDRAQRAQHHPTTHHRLMVVLPLHQALLATFRQRMAAAQLFLRQPPPLLLLQPRLSAQPTATGITPTPTVPSTPSTVAKTSPGHSSTLHTAARPSPTPSSRAWLSATNTLLVLRLLQMARAAIFSAQSLEPQAALVLWQHTRCLGLRRLSRLSPFAPTK